MRLALRLLWAALALLVSLAIGGFFGLRQSLPVLEGELQVSGARGAIEVLRDRHGIPHIFARSLEDAHFALGYVHAQDRLWQMEMQRRIGSGRLAEILGPAALDADRFMRTLGLRHVAEANLRRYDDETRQLLDAYVAGVNAFVEAQKVLPPEFLILGFAPEPWSALDSIVWTKVMALDLATNWRSELLRMRLSRTLTNERIQEFLPPYPGDKAPKIRDLKSLYAGLEKKEGSPPLFSQWLGGSNSWAVSGARTVSGKPLLANDPHLGLTAPPVWYFAHLQAPGIDAIGGTLPGVPGILVGRNERIAWGLTSTGADVQDLYLERIDSAFLKTEEIIRVKDKPDERLVVRRSRHGPVISDVSRTALDSSPRGYVVALAWTALAQDDLTLQAALKLSRARDWKGFLAAARELHAPAQTASYADADGNIGFIAAGRIPVRKPGNDLRGLAPAPGWDARYDWAGYIPFEDLPQALNPRGGAVVLANHKVAPEGYRHHVTYEWQPPYRARRIQQLLGTGKHDLASFKAMQADVVSLAAQDLLRHLQKVPNPLRDWDGTMAADRPEPLVMTAWWRELARAIYADELGDAFRGNWSARATFLANVLGGQSHWCDDVRTQPVETCDELLVPALDKALQDLRQRYGEDWKWGEAHVARHRHRPFTRHAWLSRLFDIRVPTPGDSYTVNAGRVDFDDADEPYANRHAASLRLISDLGDPQASVFIHSGGQSGNPLSRWYRHFSEPWARGEYVPMVTERARLEAAGVQRLALTPRK
jgi:penicillin G amidase